MSPAENAVKETKEEAGLDVAVKSVIAVQNRDFHNLPPYAYGVVRYSTSATSSAENLPKTRRPVGIGCFDEDNLPAARRRKMQRRTDPHVLSRVPRQRVENHIRLKTQPCE